ncbi:MAG: malonyl-CoA synthase [Pseudomonadota bacterium]
MTAAGQTNENLFVMLWETVPDTSAPFLHLTDGTTLNYDDLNARASRYASALAKAGVHPGDRVAAQIDKSAEGLCLYFGCLKAGGVFLPLNPGYTDSEVTYFIQDAEPSVVVCQPSRYENLSAIGVKAGVRQTFTLGEDGTGSMRDAADAASDGFEAVPRAADDLAAILYTSGTTGRSKGAMISARNLFSNAIALKQTWRFTSADVLVHALPVFHTHGLFVATHTLFVAGGSMIFQPRFDADALMDALPRATTMMGVPTFYTRLLSEPDFNRERVKNMRLFVSGSAPLSAQTHKDFEARTGHAIIERYGMTETSMNTSNPYDKDRKAGTVGMPLPGVEVRVCDPESGEELSTGETGVIEIRGPNVFQGYWRMPEKTKSEFRDDGFFISGDLGRYDEDGYLAIVGRDKDLIISGGFNVYPAEVETVLDAVEGVAESAVIGVPHPDFGEGVTALVVPRAGATLQPEAIRSAAAEKLAKYKVPKVVLIVEDLPRNSMGKVTKKNLRETHQDLFA